MKILKYVMLSLAGLILLILIAGIILINHIKYSPVPVYEGEQVLQGLSGEVLVYTDERGMPHIYASDEKDLYFATGYIMARERLWQMDLIRRATTGRLSEIYGDDFLQTDLFLRSLEMTAKSKIVLSDQESFLIEFMQAYTEGVNTYIGDAGRKLPPEFRILSYKPEKWTLEDIANIIGYMGWDLASGNLSDDIFNYRLSSKLGPEKGSELIPDWKVESQPVFPEFRLSDKSLKEAQTFIASLDKLKSLGIHSFSGSNNWAVSGERTTTGKPFLSNDMHQGLNSPGIWIQIHQVVPGKLNVTGVAVPGQPFVVAGHNETIAWGLTNLMVDDIDLFAEKINPENENQYFFNGEWRDMVVSREIIRSKKGRTDTLTVRYTHRGPVISGFRDISDTVLSMRWSGYDPSNELMSVYLLNRASDWDEFRKALTFFSSISQNFAYADVNGNIGLATGGGIPVRKGYGSMIRPGDTDEYDWKGYVPPEQLPFSYNPDNGYVSSANNKTVGDEYPYYISSRFYVPYRISRIRQMIEEKKKLGTDDFKRLITDQHSSYAALLTPHILSLESRFSDMGPVEKDAFNELRLWDYEMNKDKVSPAIFEFFTINFARNLLADELGELFSELPSEVRDYYIYKILKTGADSWVDDVNSPLPETLDDIIFRSYRDGIRSLCETYGDDMEGWKWGAIHKITLEHPMGSVRLIQRLFGFNSETYGAGGSHHTVCTYTYREDFSVYYGASERHIFNTSDWDDSYTVIPTGTSGIPADEFYLSQTETYINGEFYKDAFTYDAVRSAAKYILKLKPGE